MMVEIVKENEQLIKRYRTLIKEQEKHLRSRKIPQEINDLQTRILRNVHTRLHKIGSDVVQKKAVVRQDIDEQDQKRQKRKAYKELKEMYRESMALAKQCTEMKRMLREQGIRV